MTKANDLASLLDANGDVVSSALDNVPAAPTPSLSSLGIPNHDDITVDGSGSVGIGTSSPQRPLVVSDAGTEGFEFQPGSASGQNTLNHYNRSTSSFVNILTNADQHIFGRADGEKVRIDSSGNLLVGTTTSGGTIGTYNGFGALSGGTIFSSATSNRSIFARRSTDGSIIDFRKDGSTVGSIGVGNASSYTYIGTGDTGLMFNSGSDFIQPWNPSTNGSKSNAIDLGNAGNRFKNLYLSGGVYLGGTGSANYLDDYEEGTWTPILTANSVNPTYSAANNIAHYVKIGSMVYFCWYSGGVNITSSGSGNAQIEGLPFSSANAVEEYWQFNFTHGNAFSSTACSGGYIAKNSDRMVPVLHGSIASPFWASGGGKYIMIAGSYRTTA